MVNNFYVAVVCHSRKLNRGEYSEKLVLYSTDGYYFQDLLNQEIYTTDEKNKDYVLKSSIIPTDIRDYDIDYLYLLNNHKIDHPKEKNLKNARYF